MCYSLAVLSPKEIIRARFNVEILPQENYPQYYYVSAFDYPRLPVVTGSSPQALSYFHWGLIPSWVKTEDEAETVRKKTMNARAESIYDKPAFRRAAASQHCLVLVDGFFEWQDVSGRKYPYFIRLKTREPFALAGLWDVWTDPSTAQPQYTVSIVTCPASPLLSMIHNTAKRMPVLLPRSLERRWIDPRVSAPEARALLVPCPDEILEAFTVAKIATSRGTANTPEAIAPYRYPELSPSKGQTSLL